jgi:hypothetical protein
MLKIESSRFIMIELSATPSDDYTCIKKILDNTAELKHGCYHCSPGYLTLLPRE